MQLYKHIIKILIFTFIHDKISADGLIAQLVEQLTLNQLVRGSSPREPKIEVKLNSTSILFIKFITDL